MANDDDLRWELLETEPLHDYRIFRTERRTLRHPSRPDPRAFYVMDCPDWVNVVALTPDDHVVLIRQYRHGVDDVTLEIPGGVVDPGEAPRDAAVRELREETGYEAATWREIGVVQPNPAIQTNRAWTWLALDARPTAAQDTDENEIIHVETRPLGAIAELVADRSVEHALVVAAFAHLVVHAGGFRRPGAR